MGSQQAGGRNPSPGGARRGKEETKHQGPRLECAGCSLGGASEDLGSCVHVSKTAAKEWGCTAVFLMVA